MTSFRQIEANRRNARLSTGPVTEEGKRRSRQNALRHGLTAETVIDALEDAEDYAAFEMAVTADYDAQSAVERELVLRLASLLWRLRRATTIESGLFKIQAKHLLQFRQRRQAHQNRQKIIDSMYQDAVATENDMLQNEDEPASSSRYWFTIDRGTCWALGRCSRAPLSASPTCRPIPSTGSVGMRPRFGAKLVRFCSRFSVSTAASHGRG